MSIKKQIIIGLLTILFSVSTVLADYRDDAKVIKVSGGEDHTLVLTQNNWAWGCGENSLYQIGDGTGQYKKLLVRVLEGEMDSPSDYLEDINDIAAGWQHSLALDVNGFVWAWGQNGDGELGNDSTTPSSTPVQVYGGEMGTTWLQDIISIAAGRSGTHSLAVDVNNFAYSWGNNNQGQLGDDNQGSDALTPVKVHGGEMGTTYLEDIISVSAGEEHSMALDDNGFVWCWGDDAYGKLGAGGTGSMDTPVEVHKGEQDVDGDYLKNIVAISAGWDHCMALEKFEAYDPLKALSDPNYTGPDPNFQGRVYTWGNNGTCYGSGVGRLGDGTTTNRSTPVLVLSGEQDPNDSESYLKDIIAISAGEDHCLALDVNGVVWAWGYNYYGQLGNGTTDPCTTPVKVVGPNGVEFGNIVAISAGYWHSMAIDVDGTIWVWGKGLQGRLALGDVEDRLNPYPRPVVYNLTQETFHFGIQPAIDDANSSGDIIEASEGTYFEDVDFLTKTITLKSTDPNNWGVVADTVIQGSGSSTGAVSFNNNSNSVLTGFTITNNDYGIKCNSSSPDITNCVVENCDGHGLYCLSNSTVDVVNCKISGNGTNYNEDGINCSSSEITLSNCFIEDSAMQGMECSSSDVNITDSIIQGSGDDGIKFSGGDVIVYNCVIKNNSGEGIYNSSSSSGSIINNRISGNDSHGIYSSTSSAIAIKNNWVYDNGAGGSGDGIYIPNAYPVPATIRNNTIVNNADYGIRADYEEDASVSNCIIWDNEDGELSNCTTTYSCVKNGSTSNGNINNDPCFVNDVNDNYHISYGSPCIDSGNSSGNYDGETDIDGEDRVIDIPGIGDGATDVDMGADEYDYRETDFNNDGVVNFIDYAMFANKWQTDVNDPNFDDTYDLDSDNDVDMADLGIFSEDWLWVAGWTEIEGLMMMMDLGIGLEKSICSTSISKQYDQLEQKQVAEPIELSPEEEEKLIGELLNWLDEIWFSGDLKETMTEEEYLEFRKAIEESGF